jgi:hypothetical protein
VTRRGAAALTAAAVLTLGACGTTYVDTSVTTVAESTTGEGETTTLPPVDDDAPIESLLDEIASLMFDLDQRIIDQDDQVGTFQRIDDLWTVAERKIREGDPDDVPNFESAIELARTGVERRRPADASKGYKIFVDVADAYLGR